MREKVLTTSRAPASPELSENKMFHASMRTLNRHAQARSLRDPKVQGLHNRLSIFYESVNPDHLGNVSAIVKLFEGKSAIFHPLTSDSRVHLVNQQSFAAVLTAQAEGGENRDAEKCSQSQVRI